MDVIFIANFFNFQTVLKKKTTKHLKLTWKQVWCQIIDRVAQFYNEYSHTETSRYEIWYYFRFTVDMAFGFDMRMSET